MLTPGAEVWPSLRFASPFHFIHFIWDESFQGLAAFSAAFDLLVPLNFDCPDLTSKVQASQPKIMLHKLTHIAFTCGILLLDVGSSC